MVMTSCRASQIFPLISQRRSVRAAAPACTDTHFYLFGGIFNDEIHDWLRVPRRERIMSLAFLDDDRDLSTQFFVSLFNHPRVVVETRVETAANTDERHARPGEYVQAVEQRLL